MKRLGKRGDRLVAPTVVFIVAIAVIAGVVSLFIWNSSTGSQVFEEASAKQIASLIDRAKPGTTILLNMKEPLTVFSKNKFNEKDFRKVLDKPEISGVVVADNEGKTVIVNLKDRGGYNASYFSDNFVETSFSSEGYLLIKIMENENA